jgi:hypothetical protein
MCASLCWLLLLQRNPTFTIVPDQLSCCRLLGTFQSTLDEITIIAQPEEEPQDSTAAAAAAAWRSVQIKSFYDPAKGMELCATLLRAVTGRIQGEAAAADMPSLQTRS